MVGRLTILRVLAMAALVVALPAHVSALGDQGDAVAGLDELYERRGEPGKLDELIAAASRLVAAEPADYDAVWRLARAWSWRGYTGAGAARAPAAEQAMALGRRAVELAPHRVEGHFAYAIAVGVYADAVGVGQALVRRLGFDFERAMRRAYELDRHFDGGSPMVALGRYYYELPWPLRDLEQSRRLLEEATQSHPGSLRGHLYLAETYHALDRDADARREIAAVLSTPSTDPGAAALRQAAGADLRRWFGDDRALTLAGG
jgi:hypothetical protein